jgi:hypothetical protein
MLSDEDVHSDDAEIESLEFLDEEDGAAMDEESGDKELWTEKEVEEVTNEVNARLSLTLADVNLGRFAVTKVSTHVMSLFLRV